MSSGFGGFKNEVIVTGTYHARVHQGVYFSADRLDLAMADAATIELLVQVGANPLHLRPQYQGTATATFEVFEGPTFDPAGTPITPVGRNRAHSITPTPVITHSPTVTVDGLELDVRLIPGGSGGNAGGGEGSFEVEWHLAANTDYLFRGTNIGGNAQAGHLHLNWYEEIPGLNPLH